MLMSLDIDRRESSVSYSTEWRPRAVRGRGTGEETVEFWLEGSSSSTSLAELGGRELKGFSPTCSQM